MRSWNILGEGLRLDHHLERMPHKARKQVSNNKRVLGRRIHTKDYSLDWLADINVAENKTVNGLTFKCGAATAAAATSRK